MGGFSRELWVACQQDGNLEHFGIFLGGVESDFTKRLVSKRPTEGGIMGQSLRRR